MIGALAHVLGTLWYPQVNPIGSGSIGTLLNVGAFAFFVWWTGAKPLITIGAIVFTLIALFVSEGSPRLGRRFPNADDFVGYYIFVLAGICCALETARRGSWQELVYGGVVMFAPGWFLTVEAVGRTFDLIRITRELTPAQILTAATVLWCVIFALLMRSAAKPFLRRRREARGLCPGCGYDMRESPLRCPECGEPSRSAGA